MYGNTVIVRIVDREGASRWFASYFISGDHAIIYILVVEIKMFFFNNLNRTS